MFGILTSSHILSVRKQENAHISNTEKIRNCKKTGSTLDQISYNVFILMRYF
nr:hypothetical protein CKG001_21730 [Bdellovibrio sp. CKG001]BFD63472.1 hypothetical protein BdHM001_21530 [Bdellovibrio sp. HM001]